MNTDPHNGELPCAPCGCAGADNTPAASRTTPLRQADNATRKRHHPALARLLSDHLGTTAEWEAPPAETTRRWFAASKSRAEIVGLLLQDIFIHRTGRLCNKVLTCGHGRTRSTASMTS